MNDGFLFQWKNHVVVFHFTIHPPWSRIAVTYRTSLFKASCENLQNPETSSFLLIKKLYLLMMRCPKLYQGRHFPQKPDIFHLISTFNCALETRLKHARPVCFFHDMLWSRVSSSGLLALEEVVSVPDICNALPRPFFNLGWRKIPCWAIWMPSAYHPVLTTYSK